MLASIIRLFALRPLLTLTLFGIPILILVLVGLFTIWALKIVVFVILPIAFVFWLFKRMGNDGDRPSC